MASGDSLIIFTPLQNEPPASNYATLDLRNYHPVLDFDGGTNETAIFSGVMPRHYAGSGITVNIHWASDGTANDVDWDVGWERIGDSQQDIDSDGFATVNSTDGTSVPGTSGNVEITAITFTNGADMDSVAVGEGFRLKVTRDAANDTSTDDVQLLFIEIKET